MKIALRKCQPEDTESLLRLFYDTVHTINSKDYPPEQLDAWAPKLPDIKRWRARFKSSKTMVAEMDGILVGFGNIERESSTIAMLYVHKDHQDVGVATAVLKKLEKELKKGGADVARAEANITSRPFFEKRGYQLVREHRKMLNGIEFLNFIMEKPLGKPLPLEGLGHMSAKENKMKKSISWGDLFINKFFDLLMVIFGVTIAFQLNNWKVQSDQRSLQRFYLESMLTDLDKDIEECEVILNSIKVDSRLVTGYLRQLGQPNPSIDSLGIVIVSALGLETFKGHQGTYATLLNSNGLSALEDRAISSQITDYYTHYVTIARFEKVYTELLLEQNRYFSQYCDYITQKIVDPHVIELVQTGNYLLIDKSQLNESIENYTEMIENAQSLKKSISSSIQK